VRTRKGRPRRMPCLLVFSRSGRVLSAVRSIAESGGWEVRSTEGASAVAGQDIGNVDAALFDLQDAIDNVDLLIRTVAASAPFLPLLFLSDPGVPVHESGSGLRYHVDPQHLDDLEHILISLSFSLPLEDIAPLDASEPSPVPRVLIVDDNIQLASLIGRTFRALERYDVRVVTSGFEAVSILPAFRPNVAIIDLVLSDMDGRDLCAFIRGHDKLKDTKILAVSGYLTEARAEERCVHFDAYLEKPFRMQDVLNKVLAFLQ